MSNSLIHGFVADQSGSVSLEAIYCLPVLVLFLLISVYLNRVMHARSELVQATRTVAMNEAINDSCAKSAKLLGSLSGLFEGELITCSNPDEEGETPQGDKFWEDMQTAVDGPFRELLEDVKPDGPILGVQADGRGLLPRLKSAQSFGLGSAVPILAKSQYMVPSTDFWTHDEKPWKAGYDPILWKTLGQRTQQLFPNVFPARGGG